MDDLDEIDLLLIDDLLEQDKTASLPKQKNISFESNFASNEETRSTLNTKETSKTQIPSNPPKTTFSGYKTSEKPKENNLIANSNSIPVLSEVSFLNYKYQSNTKALPKKEQNDKTKPKKTTPLNGQQRLTEYMKHAEKTINTQKSLAIMTPEEIKNYYKNYEVAIGKNSGLEPKLRHDPDTIKSWVYLLTKAFREYQFKIVETCLFYNTMVCLPTGLGKTFIAANVMLNFYRWFPLGKIFFLAPTKPLVTQQKDAIECLNSIDSGDIIEITGTVAQKKRQKYYYEKRMFFMTPQTLENDLEKGLILPEDICLVIFDEAHKALGKYAYTNITKALDNGGKGYRIVALTATPGNNEEKIQEVLENLHISRLEVKDESDDDVRPYVQNKDIREIIIKDSSMMTTVYTLLNDILMKPIQCLNDMKLFRDDKFNIKKPHEINNTKLMQILNEFKANEDEISLQIGMENKSLFFEIISILRSFAQAKKTLQEQGINSFIQFIDNFRSTLKNKYGFTMEYKKKIMGFPEFKKLEECIQDVSKNGEHHPKLQKLLEILTLYFSDKKNIDNKSRVMIFTNNRASATEIHEYLKKEDKISASIFVGQSSHKGKNNQVIEGLNQKKQIEIIEKFKEYAYNTLIATCIGEEGLDIGEIDLIICYDSGFSPIRMVQRMGRTGRKREGRVLVLLMEGREYYSYRNSVKKSQTLKSGLKASSNVKGSKSLLKTKGNNFRLYSFNPRMIPEDLTPKLVMINDINEEKLRELKERDESAEILDVNENSMQKMLTEEDGNSKMFSETNPDLDMENDENEENIFDNMEGIQEIEEEVSVPQMVSASKNKKPDSEDDDLYDNLSEIFENEENLSKQKAVSNPIGDKNKGCMFPSKFEIDFNGNNNRPNPLKRKFGDQKDDLDDLYSDKKMKWEQNVNQGTTRLNLSQDSNLSYI